MNYSVELWDSYNKVENNLLFHLRGLKDFIYMVKELSKSIKIFSDNLKHIYSMNLRITTNESLSSGIDNFRNNLFFHYNLLERYISSINSEIITPLNNLQETMLKKLNANYKETINAEKNYESYITQIDFTRNKFHSRVKQLENKMIELEMIKNNNNEENKDKKIKEDNIIDKDADRLEDEIKNCIVFAKDSEKIYLSYIKYTNRIQEEYVEIKKKNLNEIQNLEVELGEKIKKSINKLYSFQNSYIKNLNIETEKKIKTLDEIDINNDISLYIKNNRTNEIPPFKFDYVPYISNLDKRSSNEENLKNIYKKVKEEIRSRFPEEKDISLLKTKTDKEIEAFIDSILRGENEKVINANEENLKIVSNKYLRRLFLKYLNRLRNYSHLILNDFSYKIIGNLLKEFLCHSYKEKDFESIKLIMVISMNLFKINKVSNKPRIFLQNYLINNQLWRDINFWENLIKYDIIEEMHNQKKYNLYLEENDVLKNVRIKDIVKNQLSIQLYNMISFELNASLMNKVLIFFSSYYKLQKNALDSLNKIINNYKSKRIELKEKKNLNNSFDLSLMNKNTSNSSNNSKINIFYLTKEIRSPKIKNNNNINIIEPVKQDEQKINDCFEKIDKEIIKKNNIFKDNDYDNIIIMESKSKINDDDNSSK